MDVRITEADKALPVTFTSYEAIEDLERHLPQGAIPQAMVSMKLRRVLLLQDASVPGRADVTVARIDSLKEKNQRGTTYQRLTGGTHPSLMLIGDKPWHGTNGVEAVVNLLSVAPIAINTILRCTGYLTLDEMQAISEKLVTTLELDISRLLEKR